MLAKSYPLNIQLGCGVCTVDTGYPLESGVSTFVHVQCIVYVHVCVCV